jgi:hypothetical protein
MSGSIVIPTPTVALSALAFDQSIGVNIHMGYTGTAYGNIGLVESALSYLGVVNIRDNLWWVDEQAVEALTALGYKADLIIAPASENISTFVALVDAVAKAEPGSVAAIEGPNEVNIWAVQYNGGSSLADAALYQQALYAAVRTDSNLNSIPVYNLTMAFTDATQYAQLGNLSSAANYANSHLYANDEYSPQTSFNTILPFAHLDAPGLPTVITETGYETNPADGYSGADQTVQAKYTLDSLMDAFKAGVSKTYLYELLDEGGYNWGLFDSNGTPKLAATAIHNLTTILADPGSTSSFTPGSLSYAVTNLPTNGNQMLLEKSGGTFDLALWAEPMIWNPSSESEIAGGSQTTTVSFGQTQPVVLVFDPLLGTTPIAAYLDTQSVQIALTDHPLIVEVPGATATLSAATLTGFSPDGGLASNGTTNASAITLTGTAIAGDTVLVFDNAVEIGAATANASGIWSFATGTLAGGANAFTSMAVDAAGDISPLSAALDVTVSALAAVAPMIAPIIVNDTVTSTNQAILSGTAEANSTVNVFEDATLLGSTTADASGAWSYTTNPLTNSSKTLTATATTAAGYTSAASNSIDPAISPIVTSVAVSGPGVVNGSGVLTAGSTVTLTLNTNEAVTVSGTPTLELNDGGTGNYTAGSGTNALTFSYTVSSSDSAVSALAITWVELYATGATIADANGNPFNLRGALTTFSGLQVDPSSIPTLTSVVTSPSSGSLNAGKTVMLTLNLSEVVTVAGGTPTLSLNDGGTATYVGGSGSDALTFSYTVVSGQNTQDLTVTTVNLNGATVTDTAGNNASFSGSLTPTGTLAIDTTAPAVVSVVASGAGISNGNGDLDAGNAVRLTLTMSEAVTVTGGTPTLTLNDGGTATYIGGSGSNALTFSCTVAAGQNTSDLAVTAVNLNSATVADTAGNAANLGGAVSSLAGTLQIDTTAPSVLSVAASGSGISNGTGDLDAGKTVTLTLTMSEVVTVAGGTPTFTLNDGGTATYVGGSGSAALTFSYIVATGQNTADLAVTGINLKGATVTDSAGNAANLSGALASLAGTLQIDTTAPSVLSVAASGSGIVNGTGDLNAGKTVTLTLNLSEAVTVAGGTPTLTLNDGGTATYVGGSGSAALTFSYTVGAGQNTADLAVTAVNLNSATVADSAGNVANLSGALGSPAGTLQIDTTAPSVLSVAASGNGIVNGTGDLDAGKTVTLTLSMSEAVTVAGGTPTLTLNDGGTATYTGGSGSNTLNFTYTVAAGQNTSDLNLTGVNLNGATIADGSGDNATFAALPNPIGMLQIDTTPPARPVIATDTMNRNKSVTLTGTAEASSAITVYDKQGTLGQTHANASGAWSFTTAPFTKGFYTFTATATDAAGNVSALSNSIDPPVGLTVIQTDTNSFGSISLAEADNDYFLYAAETTNGPELEFNGTQVTDGEFAGWAPIGAVQTSTGYDVAWKDTVGGGYSVWSVSSSGNFTGNLLAADVPGNSLTLEMLETTFGQDLNGDGAIGPPTTLIQTDTSAYGTTSLTQIANQYFLNSGRADSALSFYGSPVTAGEFAGWSPIGAVQTSTGYDVAWTDNAGGGYSVWSVNSNGNFTRLLAANVPGTSATLESLETAFGQDLNGDGMIGPKATVIHTDTGPYGTTSLTQVGNQYFLSGSGTDPALSFDGSLVTAGEFAGWSPIGAVQTATDYDVAWKDTVGGGYSVWSVNSNGNFTGNLLAADVPGNSLTLEMLETTFGQDLNGDGTIGSPTTVIYTDTGPYGTTSLTQVGNQYFLSGGGTDPALSFDGSLVTAGEFAGWSPIGAVQTATGYDVAWKDNVGGRYSVWSVNGNGNFTGLLAADVSSNNQTLESLESVFGQDLNGDGVVGLYAAPGTTLQISQRLSGASGAATIGVGAILDLSTGDSASVTFAASTGLLKLDQPSTFSGTVSNFGAQTAIDLPTIAFDTQTTLGYAANGANTGGTLTVSDGTHAAAIALLGQYTAANFVAASDGHGSTMITDPGVVAQNQLAQPHA